MVIVELLGPLVFNSLHKEVRRSLRLCLNKPANHVLVLQTSLMMKLLLV